jgi:putative membrane protein
VVARDREPVVLLAVGVAGLAVSGWAPKDRFTWFLEVLPALIALPVLVATYRRFPLTRLAYRLILLHAAILMVGGHYTYAEVPLGEWMKRAFGFARNHYDRIGHFAQGFVPAILTREILLRRGIVRRRGWLFFLVTCVCLAISAGYELFEWATAEATGQAAEAFLGTQGDPWDTQWDMFFALVGSLCAQAAFGRVHDRELARLPAATVPASTEGAVAP